MKHYQKSVLYFAELHKASHDLATSILLNQALLKLGDSVRAEKLLVEALDLYDHERQVVRLSNQPAGQDQSC